MSSEECPYCGKTFKRLKSHLPHCKAAATTAQTTQIEHRVKSSQASSAQLETRISGARPKAKKSPQTLSVEANPQSKKSTKVSKVSPQSSSPAVTDNNVNTPSPPLSSSSLLPPSTKKKKSKLSEQIEIGSKPSSNTTGPHPTIPEKSLHAGTRSASEDLLSGSRSRTPAQTRTSMIPDTKPKDASKNKTSKTKKAAARSLSKDTDSLDAELNKSIAKPCVRDLRVDIAAETEDSVVKKSDQQARITIQDVKTILNRAKPATQSSRVSFLSQTDINHNLETSLDPSLSPVSTAPVKNHKDDVCRLVAPKTLSEQLPCTGSQQTEPQPVQKSSKSLIYLQRDGSPQPKQALTTSLLPSGHPLSQVSQATRAGSMTEALKVGHRMTDFLPLSTPPPHLSHNILSRVETLRDKDVLIPEDRKPKAAHRLTRDALMQQSLGEVRLRELPEWLSCKAPSHPRDVVNMVHRGWQWYYRRYINVKKGGVGGLAMLLAGYCVLSYVWSYPHIKSDRWRKYH